MSQLTGREPGAVGAALDDPDSWCGIIVDGHHVDPVVLRIAMRCKRPDRFMLVTDAMPTVGAAEQVLQAAGPADLGRGQHAASTSTAGSPAPTSTWRAAVRNAMSMLGVDLDGSLRMASRYPAQFLRPRPRARPDRAWLPRQPRAARRAAQRPGNLDRRPRTVLVGRASARLSRLHRRRHDTTLAARGTWT